MRENCKYGLMRGNRTPLHGIGYTGTKLETIDTAKRKPKQHCACSLLYLITRQLLLLAAVGALHFVGFQRNGNSSFLCAYQRGNDLRLI